MSIITLTISLCLFVLYTGIIYFIVIYNLPLSKLDRYRKVKEPVLIHERAVLGQLKKMKVPNDSAVNYLKREERRVENELAHQKAIIENIQLKWRKSVNYSENSISKEWLEAYCEHQQYEIALEIVNVLKEELEVIRFKLDSVEHHSN